MTENNENAREREERTSTLAMVQFPVQRLKSRYEPETALVRGTLFPRLYKPFRGRTIGETPDNGGNRAAGEAYAIPFAAWEMRLFLDTHPDSACALSLYRDYCRESPGSGSYACAMTGEGEGRRWTWLNDPWPWEIAANEEA